MAWAGRQSRQAKHEKTVSLIPVTTWAVSFLLPPRCRRLICGLIKRDEWITLLPLGFKPTSKPVVFSPDAVPVHSLPRGGKKREVVVACSLLDRRWKKWCRPRSNRDGPRGGRPPPARTTPARPTWATSTPPATANSQSRVRLRLLRLLPRRHRGRWRTRRPRPSARRRPLPRRAALLPSSWT